MDREKGTAMGGTEEISTNHMIYNEPIPEKSLVGQGTMTEMILGRA